MVPSDLKAEEDFSHTKLEINQDGKPVCPLQRGPVEMTYKAGIAYAWSKSGNHTVQVQMFASNDTRMTDFEGTVWINGGIEGGDGWLWLAENRTDLLEGPCVALFVLLITNVVESSLS